MVVMPALTLFLPEACRRAAPARDASSLAAMATRERRAIDVPDPAYVLLGRLLRTFGGGVRLLSLVPDEYLCVLLGSLVVAAVTVGSISSRVTLHDRMWVVGGVASGIMGTATAIGGRRSPSSTRTA